MLLGALVGYAAYKAATVGFSGGSRSCARNSKPHSDGFGGPKASCQAVASRRKAVWKLLGLFMLDGWEAADNEMLSDLNGLLQGQEINSDAWHGEFQKVVKRYLKKDRQIDF